MNTGEEHLTVRVYFAFDKFQRLWTNRPHSSLLPKFYCRSPSVVSDALAASYLKVLEGSKFLCQINCVYLSAHTKFGLVCFSSLCSGVQDEIGRDFEFGH